MKGTEADNLRQSIEKARLEFRAAMEGASSLWERSHAPDDWSHRQICEHVCGAELGYAGAVASALGLERPAWQTFELRSPSEALTALDQVATISRSIMARVEDADLSRRTPGDATVLEAMEKASSHLIEHTAQMQAGA